MLYFSELRGKKVITEDRIETGILEDIVFLAEDTSFITKFVIRDKKNNKVIIPIDFLKSINKEIIINKNYLHEEISENELFVLKNLLDKQIIDLSGNKIVRVNDVAIQDKPNYYIAGVDIGLLGVLRNFKLDNFLIRVTSLLNIKLSPRFLSWAEIQPLELSRGHVKLKKKEEKITKLRPEDLAAYLDETNISNVIKFINILDEEKAAKVISNLNINYQTALFKDFAPQRAAKVISIIDPDNAVDILLTLPRHKFEEILNYVPDKEKKEILHLFKYSKTSIGELITSEFITANPEDKIYELYDKIKKETDNFYYCNNIYIINKKNQLVGVINLHELIMHNLNTQLYKIMTQNVIVLHLTTPKEIAIMKMLKYRLHALPVIDDEKKLVGIVTLDDLANFILKKIRL